MTNMKHVPTPMIPRNQADARLREAIEEYEHKRAALAEAHDYLQGLRATLKEHRSLASTASSQAEAAIRTAKGRETEEQVELHEMSIRKERQAETVEKMIVEQELVMELCQIEAYGARLTYEAKLQLSLHATDHSELQGGAEELFRDPAAARFLNELASMTKRVEDGVYNNSVYMATHGVDVSTFPGKGRVVQAYLSSSALAEVKEKIRIDQLAAIGEVVAQYLPDPADSELAGGIHRPIEPLSCEAAHGELGSGLAISRRRRELLALLDEQAA